LASSSRSTEGIARRPSGEGILPSQDIRQFVASGVIRSEMVSPTSRFNPPASTFVCHPRRIAFRASFLPGKSTTLLDKAKANGMLIETIDISRPTLLERDAIYIIP